MKADVPIPGHLGLVVLLDDMQFHTVLTAERIPQVLEAMERRIAGGAEARGDRIVHMSLRQHVYTGLLDRGSAQTFFNDVGAAACLWLALRHYEGGADLSRAVDRHVRAGTILTASISRSEGSAPGTSWSFMVGARVHDGRPMLEGQPPDQVRMMGSDVTGGLARTREPS